MLSNIFERVYVINLSRRQERLEAFYQKVPVDWPFKQPEQYTAIDGGLVSPPDWWDGGGGAWGCYKAHLRILEDCLNNEIYSVLILEDDAVYDEKQRVVLERVDRNRKLITMEYIEYPDTNDVNAVHRKTVETGPFGEQNIVFTNNRGEVLLREEVAPLGIDEPSTIYHFRYNMEGKRTHTYSGGVVLGYIIIAGEETTLALELSPDKGMIEISEFYDDEQNGPKSEFFRKTIQNGINGTPIIQEEVRYEKFDVTGKIKWKTKQDIQFADEEAKMPIATSYQYELYPKTDKVLQKITILPVIPKEQNGTGKCTADPCSSAYYCDDHGFTYAPPAGTL